MKALRAAALLLYSNLVASVSGLVDRAFGSLECRPFRPGVERSPPTSLHSPMPGAPGRPRSIRPMAQVSGPVPRPNGEILVAIFEGTPFSSGDRPDDGPQPGHARKRALRGRLVYTSSQPFVYRLPLIRVQVPSGSGIPLRAGIIPRRDLGAVLVYNGGFGAKDWSLLVHEGSYTERLYTKTCCIRVPHTRQGCTRRPSTRVTVEAPARPPRYAR